MRVNRRPPDGRQFLMIKDVQTNQGTPSGFVVVVNWSEELKRLLLRN